MRSVKQRRTLEFSKLLAVLFVTALLPVAGIQAVSAQDYAGPSFSGSDSGSGNVPGGNNSPGAGYAHSAPDYWGNRSGGSQAASMGRAPTIGFAIGHSGTNANGGNNGNQTAVKLPAANCCGKTTRNSNYYATDYMGLSDNSMVNAPGKFGFRSNTAPGMSTMSGAGFASNQNESNGLANSRMMMQMRSAGAAGRGGTGIPGQMSAPGRAPGQVSVPGQMSGSF